VLEYVQLDDHFSKFLEWARKESVLIVILSGGLDLMIKAILKKFIGSSLQGIDLVANSVLKLEGDAWAVKFRDDSDYGNDKARAIKSYRETFAQAICLYAGDGVSDLGAAGQTDLLFAKKDKGKTQRPP
jgi:2-hydroxy-3-keto-5-methylthiopentenyl-1-phosphate phosphatase